MSSFSGGDSVVLSCCLEKHWVCGWVGLELMFGVELWLGCVCGWSLGFELVLCGLGLKCGCGWGLG